MALDQEYLTSNRGIRYPFADDSTLPVDDDKAITVFGCFIDAAVHLKSSYSDIVPEITGIRVVGNSINFTLTDKDRAHETTQITCTKSRTRFPVITDETPWCWYTFVMSSDGIKEYASREASEDPIGDITDSSIRLSDRCLDYEAHKVTSIQVYNGEGFDEDTGRRYTRSEALEHGPNWTVTGDVRLQAGYNVAFGNIADYMVLGTDNGTNGITLSAAPGAGMGKLPCDCTDGTTFKMPGLLSADGHVRLFNDTCYDLLPIKESPDYAELKMQAKCKACCTCQMYASIVNDRLVPLKDEILANKNSLDKTYATYEENVEKWNYRINNAFAEDIVISTTGTPLDAAATDIKGDGVTGRMSRCGFTIMARNDSFVPVTFEFSEFSTNGEFFESQISYMDEDLNPVVTPLGLGRGGGSVIPVTVAPGRSLTFTSFIRLTNMVKTDEQSGFVANAKIVAKQGLRVILSCVKGIII